MLKDFSLDLEDELSLIIGKNNTGKTSVLTALDKFLNQSGRKAITLDDFNVELKKELVQYLSGSKELPIENGYQLLGKNYQGQSLIFLWHNHRSHRLQWPANHQHHNPEGGRFSRHSNKN